jgi:nitric oxide reductase activation protein
LVQADLAAIDASASSSSSSSSTNPEELIEHCWGVTLEDFLPAYMKPDKFKITANALDPQVLCAIGILSSFTHSQSRLAREVLVEAVALRTDADQGDPEDKHPVVRKQDLAVAIEMVYERAGVLPAKITKVKSEAAKGKEKKKAARDKKKASGKDKKKAGDEEEEEEEEGEPA